MGRTLARNPQGFIKDVLTLASPDGETGHTVFTDLAAKDQSEIPSIEKVLSVMVRQGHLIQTGEGENATYRLTESGISVRDAVGGA